MELFRQRWQATPVAISPRQSESTAPAEVDQARPCAIVCDLDGTVISVPRAISQLEDVIYGNKFARSVLGATRREQSRVLKGTKELVLKIIDASNLLDVWVRPIPNARTDLQHMHAAGVQLALLSNRPFPFHQAMHRGGIGDVASDSRFIARDFDERKPSVEAVRKLGERLGVDVSDIAYIGNTLKEIDAAVEAGVAIAILIVPTSIDPRGQRLRINGHFGDRSVCFDGNNRVPVAVSSSKTQVWVCTSLSRAGALAVQGLGISVRDHELFEAGLRAAGSEHSAVDVGGATGAGDSDGSGSPEVSTRPDDFGSLGLNQGT